MLYFISGEAAGEIWNWSLWGVEGFLNRFTPKGDKKKFKFLLHLTRNILWRKDDYTTHSPYLTLYISLKRLGECTFSNLGVKG